MSTLRGRWYAVSRLGGLRLFAVAITGLNILGHGFLGFEQSWAQPVVAVGTGYGLALLLEMVDASANGRAPRFLRGPRSFVDFLLPAHITGVLVAMLLYPNDRLWVVAFAVAVAIGSKAILRARVGNATRHFLNPANIGISTTLLLFPWVGIAPPYHYTENISGAWDWALPGLILVFGIFLSARYSLRLPLVAAWLGGFALQALFRSLASDTPIIAAWVPMTGMAFILYSFFMITDPVTTPSKTVGQVLFGLALAAAYGVLVGVHVVFGLFFALTIVCALRGLGLYFGTLCRERVLVKLRLPTPMTVGRFKP